MTARVVAVGAGTEAAGGGSATNTVLTVPANVADTDVTVIVACWNATALETPPSSSMLGGDGWTTLVAPRTDGTMGWAAYAARGLLTGDLVVHQLGAARSVLLLDAYVRDSVPPTSWVVGTVTSRGASQATSTAIGMALADVAGQGSELNLAIGVERTTATGTLVQSAPGATQLGFKEALSGTNLCSVWYGQLPGTVDPSGALTITYNTASANGIAFQLAIPAAVATTGLYHPNSEQVAAGWLKGISYLGNGVATELPRERSSWPTNGFVTVTMAGGSPALYVPYRTPVLDVSCWAVASNSGRPPWRQAAQLAEAIVAATLAHVSVPRRITTPSGYAPAFVRQARLVTEPRRIPGDAGDFAHYSLDLALDWVEVPS